MQKSVSPAPFFVVYSVDLSISQTPSRGRQALQSAVRATSRYNNLDEERPLEYVHFDSFLPSTDLFSQTLFFDSSSYIGVASVR